MRVSLVIETWNLGGADVEQGLRRLLACIGAQRTAPDEVVVTHAASSLSAGARARLGESIVWVELPDGADYYEHKNRGFDASSGDAVAFTDGDCAPSAGWLRALTAPILAGEALVVAGRTSYPPGPAAAAGTALDFPLFASPLAPGAVRNFFANNVAFAREVFAARRYPADPAMFHGQCQLLGLALGADGIAIRLAPDAVVEHAWPEGLGALLAMRLLRGADTRSLAPHLLRAFVPRWEAPLARLGALPAVALLAARAVRVSVQLASSGAPRSPAAAAALVAAASIIDSAGAIASRAVYRNLAAQHSKTRTTPDAPPLHPPIHPVHEMTHRG